MQIKIILVVYKFQNSIRTFPNNKIFDPGKDFDENM